MIFDHALAKPAGEQFGFGEMLPDPFDRPGQKPFESHGYKQVIQLLNGELTPKEALFYAQRNTRNYAKRQMTWFRREPEVTWLEGFGDDASIQRMTVNAVRETGV